MSHDWNDCRSLSGEDSNYVYYKYQNSDTVSQTTDKTYAHNMGESDVYTTDGNWHTIAIVQGADIFSYYIDGECKWSKSITVNTGIGTWLGEDTEFEAYIGAFATDQNEYESLKGYMDYYQFYKGALTAEQVATFTNEADTEATVVRDAKINEEMPTVDNSDLLASVDFNTEKTDGTFTGGLYGTTNANVTTIDMTDAAVMDDALTFEEVKSLEKEFTIVFRAQLDDQYTACRVNATKASNIREQGVFALRKSGATLWKDGLYIGQNGRIVALKLEVISKK